MPVMGSIGYSTLNVIPAAKGFDKALSSQVDPQMRTAGTSGGTNLASALGGVLKKSALGIGAAAGGILGTALFKGFERLSAIDQAKAKLAGLGNTTKTVDTIMANALASVQGTAFGLGDAATVAAGAVASGIKPGKDLTASLKLVADAATIGGTSLSDMGAIFNKVAASGKLQGDVIAQLGDRGIPILQLLAKQLHTTPAEVSKLASQGKIDFAQFSAAMQSGLGGAALKSGNTFKGALANMGAALGRLGAGLLAGLFPIAKLVFGNITVFLDSLTKKVSPLADAFAAKLPGALKGIGDAIKGLAAGGGGPLKPLVDAFQGFVSSIVDAGKTAAPALLAIAKGLEPIAKLAAVAAVVGLTVAFRAAGPAIDGAAHALAGIVSFVQSNQTGFKILAGIITVALIPAFIAWGVQATAAGIATAAAWIASKVEAVTSVAAQVLGLTSTAVGWVATGAAATASAVLQAAAWIASKVEAVTSLALLIPGFVSIAAGWVASGVAATAGALAMAAAWIIALGPIALAVAAIVGVVVLVVKNWDTIKAATVAVWNAITDAVSTAVSFVIDFVKGHWPLLLAIITGPIGLAVLYVVKHWDQIKTATSAAFSAVKSAVSTAMTAVADFVTTRINNIVTNFKNLPGRIVSGLGHLSGLLVGIGGDIVRGLVTGIGALKNVVVDALLALIPGPLKKFAGKLGIGSPSKVFHGFGVNIGEGLVNGILSMRGDVTTAVAGLADAASPGNAGTFDIASSRVGGSLISARGGAASSNDATGAAGDSTQAAMLAELQRFNRNFDRLPAEMLKVARQFV